jgi:chemotaxis protein CheZ
MQRKVFRVERMFAAESASAPPAAAEEAEPRAVSEVREQFADASGQGLERELMLVYDAVARNKRELSALVGDGKERRMARAAGELGAAIEAMEKATTRILKSGEAVEDTAKALGATLKSDYQRGLAQDIQDHVVEIYEACNFQDLAGQRIGKVIDMLNAIEEQVAAMLARCHGLARPVASRATSAASATGLINGPRLDGESGHASQRDIDALFN